MHKTLVYLLFFLINTAYAEDIFVSLGIVGSDNKSSSVTRTDGYGSYGDMSSAAISFSIGTEIDLPSNFYFEPAIGYRSYHTDVYVYGSYFINLPLLYRLNFLSQNIDIGPNIKFFLNTDLQNEVYTYDITSSRTNAACGFDVILGFKYMDFYLSYEYLLKPISFSENNGSYISNGQLNVQGDYIGYGIRFKY